MSFIGLAQFYAFLIPKYAQKYSRLLSVNASFGREYAEFRKSRGKPLRQQTASRVRGDQAARPAHVG